MEIVYNVMNLVQVVRNPLIQIHVIVVNMDIYFNQDHVQAVKLIVKLAKILPTLV